MKWQMAKEFLLDLLFPPFCPWCGRVLGFTQGCICEKKIQKCCFPPEALPRANWNESTKDLEGIWACFRYQPPISEAYHQMKFAGETALAKPMGQAMAAHFVASGLVGRVDCILPVPISKKRMIERGFNQSALLAKVLAAEVDLPMETEVLFKTKETEKQMKLSREERLINVLGAYAVPRPVQVAGQRVLLVDDVLTTGSTLGECARTLLAAGAASCGALALMAVE